MNEKITTRPDAPDASTAVVVKRFGDYDLALHLDGSVTWRDTGRVPVLPVAPAAEDLDPQAFEHTPEAAAFGAAIEQAAHDSGVGWDEVHPTELACRLMAAGYSLATRQPAPSFTPAQRHAAEQDEALFRVATRAQFGTGEVVDIVLRALGIEVQDRG